MDSENNNNEQTNTETQTTAPAVGVRLIDGNHRQAAAEALTKPRRGRPPKVERAIFIEAWNKGTDLNSVADALGMNRTSASVKASQMRKGGASLKRFARGRKAKVKA